MVDLDKCDPIFRDELDEFGYTIAAYVAEDIIQDQGGRFVDAINHPDVLFAVLDVEDSDQQTHGSELKLSMERVCEIQEGEINENKEGRTTCKFCLSEPAFAVNNYLSFGLHFLCRDCMTEVGDACYQSLKNNDIEVAASLI